MVISAGGPEFEVTPLLL